jgi:hypothetical protein
MAYDAEVRRLGRTYNGGFSHSASCGRSSQFDYTDENGVKLFAVTD